MRTVHWLALLGMTGWLALAPAARAQTRPYIGFVYPAGGQQGTTFRVKLGGQGLDDLDRVFVTGSGVIARVIEYNRVLGNQETTLLSEQLRELKRAKTNATPGKASSGDSMTMMMADNTMMASDGASAKDADATGGQGEGTEKLITRIERRVSETVNRPASAALAGIAFIEVRIAPDAPPGERELRLGTPRGISNPLVFCVGQVPEVRRKAMVTAPLQVLGKEQLALRKRPASEVEERVTVPCTVNGQIASGELNRYRFSARQGQRLVISTQARQLIPFIADAVPGWFQPVLALYDSHGKEVAYDDDFRFKPDPTMLYEVPRDGDYALVIYDAIYRGREDFVYRITIGEIPFATSIFPLGGRVGAPTAISVKGWNLGKAELAPPAADAGPGTYRLTVSNDGFVSNPMSFALDTLPEVMDQEPNSTLKRAQKVTLPIMVNGRVHRRGDWDIFRFVGKSNETMVAEVSARRLDSPLDSVLKLTDAGGKVLAFNDDYEDLAAGVNTHHADSYLRARLPADGTYYVHLGDTARNAGEEYAYRLRLSAPMPDFALRVVPSSVSLRSKSTTTVNVHVIRKDGFTGPIKLALKDAPSGFSSVPASLTGTQTVARVTLRTTLASTPEPVTLSIAGTAKIEDREVTHMAVPAEDRMQAFLWRHLVPASEFMTLVFDPGYQVPRARVAPVRPPVETNAVVTTVKAPAGATNAAPEKPKFTKQQVAGRLRQLKLLYEEGLLTDLFYDQKVTECEAVR
jgi:hypothetical protein